MIDPKDARLDILKGGYRIRFDSRPGIAKLIQDPTDDSAWDGLIQDLYHQGDIGEASYAAICLLVQQKSIIKALPWQLPALAGWVEMARSRGSNPPLPDWLVEDYRNALTSLAQASLVHLPSVSGWQALPLLGVIALWKGLPQHAAILIEQSEEEVASLVAGTF